MAHCVSTETLVSAWSIDITIAYSRCNFCSIVLYFLKNMACAPKHRQGTSRRKRQTDVPEDLKTVVTGFSEKDLRANNQTFNKNLVTSFVNELAEIRFHTYEILAIYGLLVATKYGERGSRRAR